MEVDRKYIETELYGRRSRVQPSHLLEVTCHVTSDAHGRPICSVGLVVCALRRRHCTESYRHVPRMISQFHSGLPLLKSDRTLFFIDEPRALPTFSSACASDIKPHSAAHRRQSLRSFERHTCVQSLHSCRRVTDSSPLSRSTSFCHSPSPAIPPH